MQVKMLLGGSAFLGCVVLVAACAGELRGDGEAESAARDEVVGEYAARVAQRRSWLESYDRQCGVCFDAFELCQKGAEDADQLAACQVAMDACVRGGLVDGAGPDVVDSPDEDLASDDAGERLDDDADVDEDAADADDDADAEDDAGDDDDALDEQDGGAGGGLRPGDGQDIDPTKEKLIEAVEQCLVEVRACLSPDDADPTQCVQAVEGCVKQALASTFEDVCSEQVSRCRAEDGRSERVRSVERQCEARLGSDRAE